MSTDKNNLVYQEQLDDNVIEMLSEDIGSNYSLRTENTKTIIAALNEILGKDIICNAVGSPLLTTDTFAELGEKINVMVSDFKAKLLGLGVSVSSVDKMAVMIEKIGDIDLGVDADELLAPLEENLREILSDEGVELSGEETLAELIVKVDEEFDEKNKDINNILDELEKKGVDIDSTNILESISTMICVKGIESGDDYIIVRKDEEYEPQVTDYELIYNYIYDFIEGDVDVSMILWSRAFNSNTGQGLYAHQTKGLIEHRRNGELLDSIEMRYGEELSQWHSTMMNHTFIDVKTNDEIKFFACRVYGNEDYNKISNIRVTCNLILN